jgi:hypothetical protein
LDRTNAFIAKILAASMRFLAPRSYCPGLNPEVYTFSVSFSDAGRAPYGRTGRAFIPP